MTHLGHICKALVYAKRYEDARLAKKKRLESFYWTRTLDHLEKAIDKLATRRPK